MGKYKANLAVFLTAILLAGTISPWVGGNAYAATVSAPQNEAGIDYNEHVPAETATPVVVAPDLSISAEEGELFSGGNLKFEIAEGSAISEKLTLPDGQYQLDSGQNILVENGVIYADLNGNGVYTDYGEDIAKVNEQNNGDGSSLQIDFSTIPIENGNFEKGGIGEIEDATPLLNWQINSNSIGPNGSMIDQIWLGDLASKTQGRVYDSVQSNGDGTYTVTGQNGTYSYETNVDYGSIVASTKDTTNREGFESEFQDYTLVKEVYKDDDNLTQALQIGFLNARVQSGNYAKTDGKIASSFAIEAISDPFTAHKGDQLGFDWKANEGGDDYEVYGFLVDVDGNHTEILYGRGSAQGWTTNTGVIPADGTYKFRFVAGSFNRTDGTTHGATLSIDNIRILSGKVVASLAEEIGQLVTYETKEILGDRNVNITVTNGTGEQSNITTVPILMDNVLERSLTIEVPKNEGIVYETKPSITGNVIAGSEVSVKVTGPNGYTYSGTAVESGGKWQIAAISELSVPGEYTISVEATNGDAETDRDILSTFYFVNKSELEAYVAQVEGLKKEDYQSGWEDDATDSDIEFATALKEAKDLLAEISTIDNDINPNQEAIDTALKNLKNAKEQLEKPSPIETNPATFEHGKNEITIDFDKNIVLTNGEDPAEGFTVTVDGESYQVTNAKADDDKVILTVDKPLNSDATEIKVTYTKNEAKPNLFGDEENGSADESFSVIATDDFGKALQIAETKGYTDDRTTPFNGAVHQDTDKVTITIFDQEGNPVIDQAEAIIKDGNWTFADSQWTDLGLNPLVPGVYTVQVNAIDHESGKTVTKSAEFTIVNKEELRKEVAEAEKLQETNYYKGWQPFVDEIAKAKEILSNPIASQDEIDEALKRLEEARANLEKHPPVETKPATFEHGKNEITIDFDKNVVLTNGENLAEGFTVTVDGESYKVTNAKVEGDKVTLTVDKPLSSDANVIMVTYTKNEAAPNLFGDEENGSADESFSVNATDDFGKALQIAETKGNTDDRTTPFNGTVHQDTDEVTITIFDQEGNPVIEKAEAVVKDGDWTFDDSQWKDLALDPLVPGSYTVEVTAIDNESGKTVTKTTPFTIVNKEELQKEVTDVEGFDEADYRGGWQPFIDARNKAKGVLNNSTAPQDEVDKALKELEEARANLEKHPPVETKPAMFEHGKNEITIDFDKNVVLMNEANLAEGFTVTVDGESYQVTNAKADGDKVILTVDKPLNSDATETKITYTKNEAKPNLFGNEENGTADESFTVVATDEFGKALQIAETKGNTDDRTTPFNGTVHQDTDEVTITIFDQEGNPVIEKAEAVVKDGSWIFADSQWKDLKLEALVPGSYTVEVTAVDNESGKTVTKTAPFTIVNKEALQEEVAEVETFAEADYRAGWPQFIDALNKAKDVLNDPTSSQNQIDGALKRLEEARTNLEKHPPVETKPAAFEHGKNEITIDFDKNIVLTNGDNPAEGFTVTVDGESYRVTNIKTNGDKVTLTVDKPLSSDAKEVKVTYTKNEAKPNLFGDEENGTADESFTVIAKDEFGYALQIEATKGNTDDRTTPFNGTVHQDADEVTLTIMDLAGNKIIENVIANKNGEGWIFGSDEDWAALEAVKELAPGSYTYQVLATDIESGRNVTKSAALTIVNKESLKEETEEVATFSEDDYRAGWQPFADALEAANHVLNNHTASQDEVNKTLKALQEARANLEKNEPIAESATFNHGYNVIIIDFDKSVTFQDGETSTVEGFTVTVDSKPVDIKKAVIIDGNVVLTLADGTKLSSDSNVKVVYNKDSGNANLVGQEENGTAVENFEFQANDRFGQALQIDEPNHMTNDTTPLIIGTADKDAESATITVTGSNGEIIVIDNEIITINPDGTWAYQIKDKLSPGKYVVEVTTTKAGRPDVKKISEFIVVDKDLLIAKEDEIADKNLKEALYTKASWGNLVEAAKRAKEVIANPEATQDEVDKAKADLEKAYEELVVKAKLVDEEKKSAALNPSDYSTASWEAYEKALAHAREVLKNPDSSQAEIDEAMKALVLAREALTVDKSLLAKEENKSTKLNSKDYSKASWENYLLALKEAQAVLNNPNATQAEVDKAEKKLAGARAALTVDKEQLEKKKEQVEDLNKSDYTNESWNAYLDALNNAKKVLNDENAKQSEIDDAYEALVNAEKGLEKAKQEENSLPNTANDYFNWLIVGFALLAIGFFFIFMQNRRRKLENS